MIENTNLKVIYKGSSTLKINANEVKECNFYSLKISGKRQKNICHHILLIDVSVSMYSELHALKERIKLTLQSFCEDKNNYVSLILYSGHNESYRIINGVKCDKTSYSMAEVYETLEKELYTRGLTVMSEPLEEAIQITQKLANICTKHHIVLFTDGALVPTKWSKLDEETKCYEIANICKEKGIYLNTIGFGKYYDKDFLSNLSNIPHNSKFIHINDIDDYYDIILKMSRKVREGQQTKVAIHNNDIFILDSSDRIKNVTTITNLNKGKENIIVCIDEDINLDDINVTKRKKLPSNNIITDFMYSLTLNHIRNESFDDAEITLAQTKDLYLFNKLNSCYSFLEKGEILNLLTNAHEDPTLRYKEGQEEIKVLSMEEEPLCLLEILREILNDDKSKLLWDYKYPYKRIGMKTMLEKDRYTFSYDKDGYGEVKDITIGSKKLNIGLKVEIKGDVIDSLSKLKLESKIYRDYNLIVNGNINTSELSCILSRKLKMKLKKEGIIKKTIKWKGIPICILDLTKVKTTNRRILRSISQETLASYLYDVEVLNCKVWALNKHIKELFINNSCGSLNLKELPLEEINARTNFRVNEAGVFTEIRQSTSENIKPYEVYPAKVLEWKIEKFQKTRCQANEYVEYEKYITSDLAASYLTLLSKLTQIKKEKNNKQLLINLVRISSGLIEKPALIWDNETVKGKREFNKELNMNMVVNEEVTISTKSISDITVREDKYTVLTKCN